MLGFIGSVLGAIVLGMRREVPPAPRHDTLETPAVPAP